MHERQIIDAAFASVGKKPAPAIESDSIVNLAFHTMLGGMMTPITDAQAVSATLKLAS